MVCGFNQGKTRTRCIPAFTRAAATRPIQSLLFILDGQYGVTNGNSIIYRDTHEPMIGVLDDNIVMRGLTANNAAQRDDAVIAFRIIFETPSSDGGNHGLWYFQCAGHNNPIMAGALRFNLSDCPGIKFIGDVLIKAGLDNEDPATGVAIVTSFSSGTRIQLNHAFTQSCACPRS